MRKKIKKRKNRSTTANVSVMKRVNAHFAHPKLKKKKKIKKKINK